MPFRGFPKTTMTFLKDLAKNNDRDWFQENKSRYEEAWLAPALEFVTAMQKPIESISPFLVANPKRVGGSIMRIYRDTRFSKEKAPYKTNIGIQFRHQMGKDVHCPGLYVHIEPKSVFLGVGVWHPDSKSLAMIRQRIDDEPGDWKKASRGKTFTNEFTLEGDSLKRPPRGYSDDHPLIDDLKRKDFIGVKRLADASVRQSNFLKEVVASFKKAKPLMAFLCDAISVPF